MLARFALAVAAGLVICLCGLLGGTFLFGQLALGFGLLLGLCRLGGILLNRFFDLRLLRPVGLFVHEIIGAPVVVLARLALAVAGGLVVFLPLRAHHGIVLLLERLVFCIGVLRRVLRRILCLG